MADKKETCILHIGAPKTGTTALQFGLANYDDGTSIYAKFPSQPHNPNHSEPLVLTGLGRDGVAARIEDYRQWQASGEGMKWPKSVPMKVLLREGEPPDMDATLAAFDATVSDVPHRRIIYSAEALFSGDDSARGLMAALKARFDHVHGICYLRPCIGGLVSRFQQRLTQTSQVLFFSDDIFNGLDQLSFQEADSLARWRDLLAEDDLQVAVYDRDSLTNGDIIDDFCHRLKLDVTKAQKIRVNTSFSAEATALLAAMSHFGTVPGDNPHFARNKAYFNVLMYQFGQGKLGLSDAYAGRVLEANADDLDWLDKISGQAFSRRYSRADHMIDRPEGLFEICQANVPMIHEFLRYHGGRAFKRLPADAIALARGVCDILCQANPFPKRRLPASFDPVQYFVLNPDIANSKAKAQDHFLAHGCFEGRFY